MSVMKIIKTGERVWIAPGADCTIDGVKYSSVHKGNGRQVLMRSSALTDEQIDLALDNDVNPAILHHVS